MMMHEILSILLVVSKDSISAITIYCTSSLAMSSERENGESCVQRSSNGRKWVRLRACPRSHLKPKIRNLFCFSSLTMG